MVPANAIVAGRAWCTLTLLIVSSLGELVGEGEAQAKECSNPLVNTCINSDTFWPNPGPTRFATVGGTETVGAGQVGLRPHRDVPVAAGRAARRLARSGRKRPVRRRQPGQRQLPLRLRRDLRLQLDFALPLTFVQNGRRHEPAHRRRGAPRHGRSRPALRLRVRARSARAHLARRRRPRRSRRARGRSPRA